MATKRWDPNSSCNSKDDTALHLALRYHKPEVVNYLLFEMKCDPFKQNRKEETPMELLTSGCEYCCIRTIRDLMAIRQWDPKSSCNSKDDTALHLAAQHHRFGVVNFLLIEAKYDPNIKNRNEETLMKVVISEHKWHNTECTNIIRVLMATKRWDPNSSCNSQGNTALHLTVRHHRPKITHVLLSEAKYDQ